MTTQPDSPTPGEKKASQFTAGVREPAAAVLVGATAVLLFVALLSLVTAGYRYATPSFTALASSRFDAFVNLATIGFPVLAVLLATHIEPRVPRAKVITIAAMVELLVAAFFGLLFGTLIGVFGDVDGGGFKSAFENLLSRLAHLAVLAVALLFVFRVWQGLFYVPRPAPAPGYPQQYGGGYPGQEPGHGGVPGHAGYPQHGYPGGGYAQQGYPQPGGGYPPPPAAPQGYAQQPRYGGAYGQPTSAPPGSEPPTYGGQHAATPPASGPPASGPPYGRSAGLDDDDQRTQYLPPQSDPGRRPE